MISVAVLGGSGYTGKYIIKFCNEHPNVNEITIYANKSSGLYLHDVFPELVGEVPNSQIKNVEDLSYSHEVYFLALPHGESLNYVPKLVDANKKVIDLGADFRLDDYNVFFETYNIDHPSPELLINKNYGLAEQNEKYAFNLIANPGCYPTAALLSSIPVLKNYSEFVKSIDTISYSGISGAGKKVSQEMLFSENYNSVKAYNVGTHRHEVEIAQELNKFGKQINYSLTTHLLPVFSGIYSTTIIHLEENITQAFVDVLFCGEYCNSAFVRLRNTPPELKWVIGTNFCDINVKSVKNRLIITAAIDNLIKGASGQAMQNMNKLFGWNESLGIKKV
jgi:N-acetyl-gamma-glutamyl-phosphate reductase